MLETPNGKDQDGRWVREAVSRYERQLTLYAGHMLGGHGDRAADVVQETFCRLCRVDRRRVEGHLAEWLYTVCRNLVTDVLRKEGRMRPLAVEQMIARPDPLPPPETRAEHRESHQRILDALATLPARQQELVRLKFQQGLSYKQIAEVAGLTVTNVGFLLHTALKTVREQLQHEDAAADHRPSRS